MDKRDSDAIRFYNMALDYAEAKSQNEAMILSNKSAALLALGCYNSALKAADTGLEIQPENDKLIFRKTKALLGNQSYEDALNFLEEKFSQVSSLSENKDLEKLLDSAKFLSSRSVLK